MNDAEKRSPDAPKRNRKSTQRADMPFENPVYPGRLPPLRDRRQCARYVATLIRAGHRGQMPLDMVRTLVYSTHLLADLLDNSEERWVQIEETMAFLIAKVTGGETAAPLQERQRALPGEFSRAGDD